MKTLAEHKDEFLELFFEKHGEKPIYAQVEEFEQQPYELRESVLEILKGNNDLAQEIYTNYMTVDVNSLNEEEKRFYDLFLKIYDEPLKTTNIEAFRRMEEDTRARTFAILNSGKKYTEDALKTLERYLK